MNSGWTVTFKRAEGWPVRVVNVCGGSADDAAAKVAGLFGSETVILGVVSQ